MAFLTLNGVTVRVSVEGASFSEVEVGGEQERSPSGDLEGGPATLKREWRMGTTPVAASELDAWRCLIRGEGHSFPFDADTYSARGRGTSSGTGTIVTSGAKWGDGLVRVADATSVAWATQLGTSWTTLHWRYESGAWKHYICRSDGARWVDGVRNDTSTGGVAVSSGTVSLTGATGLTDFDDLVALPYAVPDSWPTAMHTEHSTRAWSDLPRVLAAGSFYPSSLTVRGRVTDTRAVRCHLNGAMTTAYTLEFTIREV